MAAAPAKRSAAVTTTIGALRLASSSRRVEPLQRDAEARDGAADRVPARAMLAAADPARGEHRHQRQRDEGREHHREGEHEAELGEEPAGGAGEERDRDEHRGERHRRRQHREEHLPRAEHRGGARPEAERALARDVLDDDDRVVDDEAGRKHQREQRQDVDREAGGVDRRDRADQRDRHGDRRDEGDADRAQEDVDDADDDGRGEREIEDHRLDRAAG